MNPGEDDRIGKALNVPKDVVRNERLLWNGNRVMRAVLEDRIKGYIKERMTALKSVKPEDLQKKQGEISALETVLGMISTTEK